MAAAASCGPAVGPPRPARPEQLATCRCRRTRAVQPSGRSRQRPRRLWPCPHCRSVPYRAGARGDRRGQSPSGEQTWWRCRPAAQLTCHELEMPQSHPARARAASTSRIGRRWHSAGGGRANRSATPEVARREAANTRLPLDAHRIGALRALGQMTLGAWRSSPAEDTVGVRGDGLVGQVLHGKFMVGRPLRSVGRRGRAQCRAQRAERSGARCASASRSSNTRPRWIRERTVPTLMPRVAAISS